MGYAVKITWRAERDLEAIYDYIHAKDSAAAQMWYRGLKAAILSLEERPGRCAVTPETPKLRHLLFGKKRGYRVIFRIVGSRREVEVLHIRHGSRQEFDSAMFGVGPED